MSEVTVVTSKVWQGVSAVGRGLRRGVIVICASAAMIVIYGFGTVATYGLSVAGISTLTLATTATPANAWRRRRGRGVWFARRRRRGWYPRRRRRRGVYFRF
jgi:hypothetical protein